MSAETLSVSFSEDASETFANWVRDHDGWYVRITPQEGEPFEAVLRKVEPGVGTQWYDQVGFVRADPESGLALDGAEVEAVRVRDVFVF